MAMYRRFMLAAALAFLMGCGGDGVPNGAQEGGGGADGLGDDAQPTAAERTGTAGGSATVMASLAEEDRTFVQKASMSSQMEVRLGNLAEDKAQSDEVRQFGEQLARDHEAANRALQASLGGGDATTAQQPGAGMSEQPDAVRGRGTGAQSESPAQSGSSMPGMGGEIAKARQELQQTQQELESASGQNFDRAYLEAMVKHHEQAIQEFERAAQSDNAQVREFAQRTLPTLRQHLERAQQLQQSIR